MSGSFLGFILEVVVATLLLATITYCVIVNRKLEKLRSDQESLKSIIRDLNQSTLHAEAAAGELRATVEKASKELTIQITRAESSTANLRNHSDRAEGLVTRLNAIGRTARDRDDASDMGSFSPRRGFPLEGAAAKEDLALSPPEPAGTDQFWPQLRLSNLSANGLPEPEQQAQAVHVDRPNTRSRFRWEA